MFLGEQGPTSGAAGAVRALRACAAPGAIVKVATMAKLIALDAGTTGVTAVLYDEALVPLRRAYREFPQHFPAPGMVEHEADDIRRAVQVSLQELLSGVDGPIAAVGITNQRETVFALDRHSGEAYGRGIVWQDRRTHKRCDDLKAEGLGERVQQLTGLLLDPYFSASKIEWMRSHLPGLAEKSEQGGLVFVTVDSLVIQALGPDNLWVTDPTNACRTLLYDIERREWSAELCELFGVPMDCLSEVRPSVGPLGTAHLPGDRRAPILGLAGDQQAALFGQACYSEGDFKTTYGTGCFLVLNTGTQRREPAGGLLTTLALDAHGQPCYAVEGSVFAGGAVIQWLRDGLGLIAQAPDSEALAREVPDTGGVILVPAFAGLGAPHWDPDARAALLGMTRGTHKSHIARAALQCIALQCVDIVTLLRDSTGLPVDTLRVDGGAVRNDLLMQMQADLAQARVVRPADVESTARGAGALAALGAGLWEADPTAAGLPPGATVFEPQMPREEVAEIRAAWGDALRRVKTRPGPTA